MSITRFISAFQRLAGQSPEPAPDEILPPDRLRRVLERERARADRTGERLSLVTFAARCSEADAATPTLVAKILRGRLRTTDEVGWMDGRRIAVVLPNTPAAGAWKVADDVCLEFPKDVPPPICTVYTYPHEWLADAETIVGVESDDSLVQARRTTPSVPLHQLLVRPIPAWKRLIDVAGAAVALFCCCRCSG